MMNGRISAVYCLNISRRVGRVRRNRVPVLVAATALAGGIAPQITPEGMEPFDPAASGFAPPSNGIPGTCVMHPGEFSETGMGILLAHNELTRSIWSHPSWITRADGPRSRRGQVTGMFATYAGAAWKINATVYNARCPPLLCGLPPQGQFHRGYIQAERRLPHDLTGYVRWEDSSGAADSPYLHLFERFARSGAWPGCSWDFVHRQALTVQYTNCSSSTGTT